MRRKIEEKLLRWKNDEEGRMPLLLYGARQVGKTFILLDFGEKNYENVVYINLETNRSVASVFENDIAPGTDHYAAGGDRGRGDPSGEDAFVSG